jgi:pentose-5-phosphate-3-epimerase
MISRACYKVAMKALVVAPSISSEAFSRLAEEVRAVDAAHADWIHVGIMGGAFRSQHQNTAAIARLRAHAPPC